MANTAAELQWLQTLLREVGLPSTSSPVIYYDNVGTVHLSANPIFHSRMKHLALDYHFIHEQVQSGAAHVTHVANVEQLADALAKSLPRPRFSMLLGKIALSKPPAILRG